MSVAKFNYNVAMPWTSKGLRKRLECDIRRDYPWLFQEYNAVVLPAKPYKQVLDYANVTVAVSDLLLQFTRGRDEFHVSIAPAHEPDDWYELGEAIDLASDIGTTSESAGNYTMSDFERLFRSNIEGLKVLFSQREYTRTSRRRFAKRMSRP
jgi:hypothetical protein